ncbi:hypothetical protein FOZ62_008351 [Perkinsus olseni]|uniref:Methyltransferase FkbM domain-containing protein n=1 Tax=Perkinsus olseni TaxID=32597 RepID=A0A7J6UFB1_PEROL|nr:hypothetical protein FOZ62_008351 [Perkinsus olseni]
MLLPVHSRRLCSLLWIWQGGPVHCCRGHPVVCGVDQAVSHAQYGQDIFVAEYFGCDTGTPRRYLDIGAFDGTNLSSTYVLERHFNFTTGICIDAHPNNFDGRGCEVVKDVVGSADGDEVTFRRVSAGLLDSQENSGSVSWVVGEHSQIERTREGLYVDEKSITRSIRSILQDADWPVGPIDFVSLDVEGSELAVMQGFPFDEYCVRLWLIEEQSPMPAANVSEFMINLGYSARQLVGLDRVYTPNFECCFRSESSCTCSSGAAPVNPRRCHQYESNHRRSDRLEAGMGQLVPPFQTRRGVL